MTDTITLWVLLFPWFVFAVWEGVVLFKRYRGEHVKTISMVARDFGPRLSFLVYLWASMASHWWVPASKWGPDFLAWIFWAIPLGLLGWDIACRREDPKTWPTWKRRARHPLTWLVGGALAGRYLFPQAGGLPW